jgi:hypothetical protein
MKENIQAFFEGNYQRFYANYLMDVQRAGGDEFKAVCPFPSHDDTKPSFNFNNQTGQFFCHGCNKKGDIFHFYAKHNGLNDRRDFKKVLKGIAKDFGISWNEKNAKIAATYDYLNNESKLHSQTVRMEPKDFWQRRPDGKGGWITKGVFDRVKPILYKLPEVLKAKEVIIVEGEKDASNLMGLNFTATTCPMGAKKWRPEYNEALKGKDVVLIPDNDQEGREHMTQVGISLNGTAKSLKWLDLPNLPSKGDVSNFIVSFGEKEAASERLAIMIAEAEPYEPSKKATHEDVILEISDFKALDLPPKQKILHPWVEEQMIGIAYSWRGVGKTWMGISVLNSVTKGEPFGPWKTKSPVPCLFLDGEMVAQDIQKRLDNSKRQATLYIYSDHYANLLGLPRAHLANESWRTKMKSILLARKVKLWVVDNLASLASGLDENKKQDWDPINEWLLELRFAGIATIMLHHESKEGKQRGTSAREDHVDISVRLKRPHDYTPEDGCRFILHFEKQRLPLEELGLISDIEFQLTQDETTGQLTWKWGNVKKEVEREILKMLDEGITYDAICSALDISKGYISKVKKQAVKDNHLTPGGKLTQSGFLAVSEG